MKAIILAAGRSTRLFPLTQDKPVSMLDLGDKTILDHQIDVLKANGINEKDIIVVFGHYSEVGEKEYSNKINCIYNPFFSTAYQIASIWVVKEFLNDDIIIIDGDTIFSSNTLKNLLEDKNDICLVVDENKDLDEEAEKVKIENNLIKIIDKTKINDKEISGEWTGITKFSKRMVLHLKEEIETIIKTSLVASIGNIFQNLIDKGIEFHYISITDPWIEIDFEEDLKKAREEIYPKIKF